MNNIDLIAKCLTIDNLKELGFSFVEVDTVCIFSGKKIDRGIEAKKVLSTNFTDNDCLKGANSKHVSIEAAACLKACLKINEEFTELRKYSYLAENNGQITLLRSENLFEYLFAEKQSPFVFCVGTLRASKSQKHLSFKAAVNYQNDIFTVTTECGDVVFDVNKAREILPILQNWYTVTVNSRGKATELTWFNKEEILNGCNNLTKIDQYGQDKYFSENALIEKYRNTLFLELIVKSLRKC